MHANPTSFSLLAGLLLVGCNSGDLQPQRAEQPILIDGDPSEWGDLLVEIEDADYDFGYANDDAYLYLCLITASDEVRRQVLVGGVHLWFDPSGGEARVKGIRYPVGVGLPTPATMGERPSEAEREAMQAQFIESAGQSLEAAALLTPDGAVEVGLIDLEGLEVNGMLTSKSLAIEMRIPLGSLDGADLALELDPAATAVGLGIYVPEIQPPARAGGQRGGGVRGGGRMGGGGMGEGRRGGPSGGPGPRDPMMSAEEIEEHITLPLAVSNAQEFSSSR